jgi:hypothetical protein
MPAKSRLLLLLFPLLTGCEMVYDLLEIPDPKKVAARAEAEGKAIGSACRQAGRSIEDCYQVNPTALKSAVFAGWREMNDYMIENKMEVMPSSLPQPGALPMLRRTPPPEPPAPAPAKPAAAPEAAQ